MKTLVEVMNTALFHRKAQLLELVLVKCIVCERVHLYASLRVCDYPSYKGSLREGKCQTGGQLETSPGGCNA